MHAQVSSLDQKCTIQGRVTNFQTGEPLRKVLVRLLPRSAGETSDNTDQNHFYTVKSAMDGSFRLEGIQPGEYTLNGRRTGFLQTNYGAEFPNDRGTVLSLRSGQQLTNIVLKLFPQAVITGRVVDDEGEPVSYAPVEPIRQIWRRGKLAYTANGEQWTDDLGQFRLTDLVPGRYYVSAQIRNHRMFREQASGVPGKPDIRPVETFYPDAIDMRNATPIGLAVGQTVSQLEIHLRSAQAYHVRGHVIGNLKIDMDQLYVTVAPATDMDAWRPNPQTVVNKDGSFYLSGMTPGAYTLQLASFTNEAAAIATEKIEVASGDVNDVTLNVVPPAPLKGYVRLEGAAPASAASPRLESITISLTPADGPMSPGFPNTSAKPDGSFTLDVSAGKYNIDVGPNPPGAYLKSVRLNGQDVLGKELDLSRGASGNLEIIFRYGAAQVYGTLRNGDKPITSASVVLVSDTPRANGSGIYSANPDQNGNFAIEEVPPGHYRCYAFEHIDTDALQNLQLRGAIAQQGAEIELRENDRKQVDPDVISSANLNQIITRLGFDSQ